MLVQVQSGTPDKLNEMKIYCCECQHDIEANLVTGAEVYPHRPDLSKIPFWKCPTCGNYVGCHYKTSSSTKPLGCIPSAEIREARSHIHRILDPLWKSGRIGRTDLYKMLTEKLGWTYHTSHIRTIEEARKVYQLVKEIAESLA